MLSVGFMYPGERRQPGKEAFQSRCVPHLECSLDAGGSRNQGGRRNRGGREARLN